MPSTANVPQLPPAAHSPVKKRIQRLAGDKGRIRADGYLDHEYNERRELFGTLRVLAAFAAVGAVIFFVFLYMRDWMTK